MLSILNQLLTNGITHDPQELRAKTKQLMKLYASEHDTATELAEYVICCLDETEELPDDYDEFFELAFQVMSQPG